LRRPRIALPGDYMTTPFGSGYDAVLLSGMMHREREDGCRTLLRKSFEAMEAGGLVVVSDVFFDNDDKNSPPFAKSFALNMMLTSDHGSAHAVTEMARWMTETGFLKWKDDRRSRPIPTPDREIKPSQASGHNERGRVHARGRCSRRASGVDDRRTAVLIGVLARRRRNNLWLHHLIGGRTHQLAGLGFVAWLALSTRAVSSGVVCSWRPGCCFPSSRRAPDYRQPVDQLDALIARCSA
jgi:hypothetical protein